MGNFFRVGNFFRNLIKKEEEENKTSESANDGATPRS